MFQNIKVDIIYHKSNTDFEMEFNLCGCCRMRLLTTKSPDKKTLVHSLARAVSRSRVIIIVGELFGQNNIVDTIAAATGSKTEITDNQKYGIDSNIDIKIIKNSIPLVTPEGYFGGCIIEKGPQTMILLSDNKNVRKSVMRSLIHPYIEELCALDLKEKAEAVIEKQDKNALFDIPEDEEKELENLPRDNEETELEEEDIKEKTTEEAVEISEADEESEEVLVESEFVFQDEADDVADERIVDDDDIEGLVVESDEEADVPYNVEDNDDIEGLIIDSQETDEEYYEDEMDLVTEDDYEEIEMESMDSEILGEDDSYEVESDLLYEANTIDLKTFKKRNAEYYNDDEALEGLFTEEDEIYRKKGELMGSSNWLLWLITIIVVALFLVVCYALLVVPASDGVSPVSYLKDIYNILFG